MFWVKRIAAAAIMLAAAAVAGGAEEMKMPMRMEDLAERLKRNCPKNVSISAGNGELTMTVAPSERKGRFECEHAVSLKPLAGRSLTFMLDVKLENVDADGAAPPASVGHISFSGTRQQISTKHSDWHTYVFKSVKVPGNGLFKITIAHKNIPCEVHIRNPRIKGDLSKMRDKGKKKKKKKNN